MRVVLFYLSNSPPSPFPALFSQSSFHFVSSSLLYCTFLSVPLFMHPFHFPLFHCVKNSTQHYTISKRKKKMSPAGSSRWSPTAEQLMILEELYRSGIRTPSASQIQQITTHLSFYGRIEGKNVFYWFQNHKARDRQKLRRKLNTKQLQLQQQQQLHHHYLLNNQDISNRFVATSFGYPPPSMNKEISFYNTPALFLQGGAENTSEGAMNCKWSVYNPQSLVEPKKENTLCNNYGWSLDDVDQQSSSCCTTRPLKTLDLFPLTASTIKEDCTTAPN